MSKILSLKPTFWERSDDEDERLYLDFRRIWRRAVLLMLCVALLPLLFLAYFDHRITRQYNENEIVLRTNRLVSNTERTVSFFLQEREAVLRFVAGDFTFDELNDDDRLTRILNNLNASIGGLVDLGLFNSDGRQIRYIGPYALKDLDYQQEPWFNEVVTVGSHISDVYLGFRDEPHIVIAVKQESADGSFFVLRATLNTDWFHAQLAHIKKGGLKDSFLINLEGVLQTPSLLYGQVLEPFPLGVPQYSEEPRVVVTRDRLGKDISHGYSKVPGLHELQVVEWGVFRHIIMGYAYIPHSPFILVTIGERSEMLQDWQKTRVLMLIFLAVVSFLIILVIPGVATSLVNDIHRAQRERAVALNQAAQANKLASLGRLAAGVAHEINNPLAIINEKAGLMGDLLAYTPETEPQPRDKLLALVDSIHKAVNRCSGITRRLLGFARPGAMRMEPVRLRDVIAEVLEFYSKEAEYRSIEIKVEIDSDLPEILSNSNSLQQVFLNLVGNAFAAMSNGGCLSITGVRSDRKHLLVTVADNGHGISEADLKKIFEPFFSTRFLKGGSGLGLFVTYGLVHELGGNIMVESTEGVGTKFFVTLPLKKAKSEESITEGNGNANSIG